MTSLTVDIVPYNYVVEQRVLQPYLPISPPPHSHTRTNVHPGEFPVSSGFTVEINSHQSEGVSSDY